MRAPHDAAPPADLDAVGRRVWQVARTQLEEQGTWKPADAELLGAYCLALQTARLARGRIQRRLESEGEEAAFFSRGSLKQLVSHPDVQLSRQAEGDAASYAAQLLLSPAARRRAGVDADVAVEDDLTALLGGS